MCRATRVLLLFCIALPAYGAKPLTVQQLQELLRTHTGHESDASLAHRIQAVELTEKISPESLTEMKANGNLGVKSLEALSLLADQSVFLDPPSAEIPQRETPDDAAAKRILEDSVMYAISALHKMPNLLAKRLASSFDDAPTSFVGADGFAMATHDLHPDGTVETQIVFRGGKDVAETVDNTATPNPAKDRTLRSAGGEFGPVLGVVLRDLPAGAAHWSHWEKLPTGMAAVFMYEVPQSASHYRLNVCCRFGARLNLENFVMTRVPAYHGKLYIDPETGTLLRLTLQADLKRGDPIKRGDLMVDYAPVQLGSASYFCPVLSIAILAAYVAVPGSNEDLVKHLNRVTFTEYHRFGSEVRIVP